MTFAYARYQHLAIDNAKPPPTTEQIANIELLLGASLPDSFRQFLAVANGGYIEYTFDVPVGSGSTEPISFCSIFSADDGIFCDETFVGEIRSGREFAQIPEGVLPFARDGGGSIAYLDLSPQGAGQVVAFVQGLPAWTGHRQESAFITLASSFDEYVSRLRIDREAVLDHLEHDSSEPAQVEAIAAWLDIGMPDWQLDKEIAEAVASARRNLSR